MAAPSFKNQNKIFGTFLLSILMGAFSSAALADIYLMGGSGAYDSDAPQIKEDDSVVEGRVGYMFNEYIGMELNYIDFGTMEIRDALPGVVTDQEVWAAGAGLSARRQISNKLWAYGRLSVNYWEYESALFPGVTEDDYSALWGFGVAWYPVKNFGLGIDATRFDKIMEQDIDTAIVNLQLRF